MPESKVRKAAAEKKKLTDRSVATEAEKRDSVAAPGSRAWVVPTFITVGLLGVLWLVVFYITNAVGITIPVFSDVLGSWNVAIGMVLMAASFALATLWK
ncbi:uncharacterized protein UPF0233 [Propionicimonas paludicola]|uniref:Cell division protein CrgA n=1 Tax=Propionicimonas paludicola TaxID=185243 RepID=A0A2A9CV88_9ACTN|nr:cell division protein CrgA [Propionicimonas paludicola]PFG17965.1 uncharacterized protein UPF0233 [Propionicimonas paludicola]